jgi:hypothetical protein
MGDVQETISIGTVQITSYILRHGKKCRPKIRNYVCEEKCYLDDDQFRQTFSLTRHSFKRLCAMYIRFCIIVITHDLN